MAMKAREKATGEIVEVKEGRLMLCIPHLTWEYSINHPSLTSILVRHRPRLKLADG